MEQYLRTKADGNRVLDIDLLDEVARTGFLDAVQRWARTIPIEPGGPAISEDQRRADIHSAVATALDSFSLPGDSFYITRKTEVWMYDVMCQVLETKYPI